MNCTGATHPDPPLVAGGTYELLRYNGNSLPYYVGPMPPTGSGSNNCIVVIVSGQLVLTAQGTFWYGLEIHDGCSPRPIYRPGLQGAFEQRGDEVTFFVAQADGGQARYYGSVSEDRIVFRGPDETLEFSAEKSSN